MKQYKHGGFFDRSGLTKKQLLRMINNQGINSTWQLKRGIEIEMEHTTSKRLAEMIALDHLVETPDYYTRLDQLERESRDEWDEWQEQFPFID